MQVMHANNAHRLLREKLYPGNQSREYKFEEASRQDLRENTVGVPRLIESRFPSDLFEL